MNNTEKTVCYIIMILLAFNLLKSCNKQTSNIKSETTTVKVDTIWQTKRDTFRIETTKFKTVYLDSFNTPQVVKNDNDKAILFKAKQYRDTLSNPDIDIFTTSLVKGTLLDGEISYNLKVPREINTTKTIIKTIAKEKSALYLFGEVGGNRQSFDNLSMGLQYNNKSRWFLSYRLNINNTQSPTHNIGIGRKIF